MAVVTDEELHAAAVKAVIQAVLNTGFSSPVKVLDLDDVGPLKPEDYVELTLTRRYGGVQRADGYVGTAGWRIGTRVVSRTVTNARKLRKHVTTALENVNITVSGQKTTPVLFETEEPIGLDDGYQSGLTSWTYQL